MASNLIRVLVLLFFPLFVMSCVPKQAVVETRAASEIQGEWVNTNYRDSWRQRLDWSDDCEDSFQVSYAGAQSGVEEFPFSDNRILVSVLCSAGSYLPSFVFFLVDKPDLGASAKPLKFIVYESADGDSLEPSEQLELWGEPFFDSTSGVLNILQLGRQAGDCGSWAAYDLNGENAELLEVWARFPCPEIIEESAEQKTGIPPKGWVKIDHERDSDN